MPRKNPHASAIGIWLLDEPNRQPAKPLSHIKGGNDLLPAPIRENAHLSDKQENNRDGFVTVVGLRVQNLVQHQGRIRAVEQSGITGLVREG